MFRRMPALLLLGSLLLAGCGAVHVGEDVTAESTETQNLTVSGAPSVEASNFAGKITVREGEPGAVDVILVRQSRARDEAQAQDELEQIGLVISQAGDAIVVSVEGPQNADNLKVGLTAELTLQVPPGTPLSLNLGAGDVTVEQPDADVTISAGAGNATVSLPADASFHLVVAGGVTSVKSDFAGVPAGGLAANIDTTVGSDPTQTLTFNLGAGAVNLVKR